MVKQKVLQREPETKRNTFEPSIFMSFIARLKGISFSRFARIRVLASLWVTTDMLATSSHGTCCVPGARTWTKSRYVSTRGVEVMIYTIYKFLSQSNAIETAFDRALARDAGTSANCAASNNALMQSIKGAIVCNL